MSSTRGLLLSVQLTVSRSRSSDHKFCRCCTVYVARCKGCLQKSTTDQCAGSNKVLTSTLTCSSQSRSVLHVDVDRLAVA
eukprot:3978-Heterococcus_DN1.PRE.2